jgi:hypothetical protein
MLLVLKTGILVQLDLVDLVQGQTLELGRHFLGRDFESKDIQVLHCGAALFTLTDK